MQPRPAQGVAAIVYAWRSASRWGKTALGATLLTGLGFAGALVEDILHGGRRGGDYFPDTGDRCRAPG